MVSTVANCARWEYGKKKLLTINSLVLMPEEDLVLQEDMAQNYGF